MKTWPPLIDGYIDVTAIDDTGLVYLRIDLDGPQRVVVAMDGVRTPGAAIPINITVDPFAGMGRWSETYLLTYEFLEADGPFGRLIRAVIDRAALQPITGN